MAQPGYGTPVFPTQLENLFFKLKEKVLPAWGSYFQEQVASAGLCVLLKFGDYFSCLCWQCCSFPWVRVVPGESCFPCAQQSIYRREYDLPFLQWLV